MAHRREDRTREDRTASASRDGEATIAPQDLTAMVKEKALALGAHLIGVAPMGRMDAAPPDLHPRRYLPEGTCMISLAFRINRGIQQLHLRGGSPMPFSRFAGLEPKFRLDDAALDLADYLEDLGWVSLPVPANQYYHQSTGQAEISHKHVAMAAGVGRLGRGGFLVTPEYGGAVQLTTVLTTAPLVSDPILEEDPCADCPQPCVAICPVGAISPDRDRVIEMEGREYRYGWLSYLRCQWCCGGMVQEDGTYARSDVPMPSLEREDDGERVRLEFLLASRDRFPWDKADRASFTFNACSKCYVVCHPERLKRK